MASESIAIDSAEQIGARGVIVKYTYNMPCDLSLILVYNLGSDRSKRVLKLHRTYNILQGIIRKLLCWSRQLRQYRWKDIFFVHELSLSCFRSHDQFNSANCDFLKWWTMWTLQRWWNSCHVTSLNLTSLVRWQIHPIWSRICPHHSARDRWLRSFG